MREMNKYRAREKHIISRLLVHDLNSCSVAPMLQWCLKSRPEVHDYKECKFSPWNPWSECKCGVLQIYRTRVLQQWSQDCGTPCDGPLKETEPSAARVVSQLVACLQSSTTSFHTKNRHLEYRLHF